MTPAPKPPVGHSQRHPSPQVFQTVAASPPRDSKHENKYLRGKPVVVLAWIQCIQRKAFRKELRPLLAFALEVRFVGV